LSARCRRSQAQMRDRDEGQAFVARRRRPFVGPITGLEPHGCRRDGHRAPEQLSEHFVLSMECAARACAKSLRKIKVWLAVTSTTAWRALACVSEHEGIEQPIAVRREQTVLHRQTQSPPIGGSLFTFRYCCGIFHFPPRPYARSFPGVRSDHLMKSHGTAAAIWSEIC
jgi:hypothetical protein